MQKDNLTFIRTALALGVLCFHAFGAIGIEFWQFAWVPAFIAISGFLITQSLTQSHSYRHFAWKRVLRIGPAFLVSLALVTALGGSVVGALVDWLSVLLDWAAQGVNPPLWSLSLEEVLYFCLALLFVLGVYRQRRTTIVTLLGLCVLLACLAPVVCPRRSCPWCRWRLRLYADPCCMYCETASPGQCPWVWPAWAWRSWCATWAWACLRAGMPC